VLDLGSLRRLRGLRRWLVFLLWYRLPIWWARKVTTISHATRSDLITCIPRATAKVSVLPCPVAPIFVAGERGPMGRKPAHLLLIGTKPNKNVERVARALAGLPVHLRIIGRLSEGQRALLEEVQLSYSAKESLSDIELLREYVESDVLVFVSTYEGFGLPIIEAQAMGLPVITSSVSSMPEVAGAGALFVDPLDEQAIRSAIATVIKSPGLAAELVAKGRSNAKGFTSDAVAQRYAAMYRELRG
jgi:glycosyltransferase involved in cell wall biosynthesis